MRQKVLQRAAEAPFICREGLFFVVSQKDSIIRNDGSQLFQKDAAEACVSLIGVKQVFLKKVTTTYTIPPELTQVSQRLTFSGPFFTETV